jgi:hypothetical protein
VTAAPIPNLQLHRGEKENYPFHVAQNDKIYKNSGITMHSGNDASPHGVHMCKHTVDPVAA